MVKKDASYDEVVQAATSGDEDAQRLMTGVSEGDERSSVARSASSTKPFVLLLLSAMGPGVVSAMAGNDAGGISTYSTAGAEFGYATLWVIPVMCVLLLVVQMTAARMGAVTGKGFAALIRERFGIRLAALAMAALLVGNVATTFSEFAGIASGAELFGMPRWVSVPFSAGIVWILITRGSYKSVEKVFLAVSLVFITYIIAAFLAGPNWGDVAQATVTPAIPADMRFISLVNLIADKEIVQELLADRFSIYNIANELYRILPGQLARERMLADYQIVRERLGDAVAPDNAARIIVEKLTSNIAQANIP